MRRHGERGTGIFVVLGRALRGANVRDGRFRSESSSTSNILGASSLAPLCVGESGRMSRIQVAYAGRFARVAAHHIVAAKQLEFAGFSETDLDWTCSLTPGARTIRADVGQALVDRVDDCAIIRAAPFVLPPARN